MADTVRVMVRIGRRMPRVTSMLAVGICALALSNCSWQRLEDAEGVSSTTTTTTIADEMRAVPTVPPATAAQPSVPSSVPVSGEATGDDADAVSDEATVPVTPPTTELVGDPRPNPDSEATLPPLPGGPDIDACTRLATVAATDTVGAQVGVAAAAESIGEQACRISAGSAVAEVYFVSEDVVSSDWFGRDGIQPVGEVGGDVVGIATFSPPGSGSSDGFTLAMISRREGAIVAVRGAGEDRALAVQLALLVESTT